VVTVYNANGDIMSTMELVHNLKDIVILKDLIVYIHVQMDKCLNLIQASPALLHALYLDFILLIQLD